MKKEQIIETVKTGVGVVVTVGVGAIVGNLVKSTTPVDTSKIVKACIKVGSLVVTGAVGDLAGKYAEEQIDEAVIFAEGFIKPDTEATDEEDVEHGDE